MWNSYCHKQRLVILPADIDLSCVSDIMTDVPTVDGCVYTRRPQPFRVCGVRVGAVVHRADAGTCVIPFRRVCLSVCSITRL